MAEALKKNELRIRLQTQTELFMQQAKIKRGKVQLAPLHYCATNDITEKHSMTMEPSLWKRCPGTEIDSKC